MLTKNWYILQSLNMLASAERRLTNLKPLNWDGQKQLYYYPYKRDLDIYSALNSVRTNLDPGVAGVFFGTGDTPASVADYKLSGDLIQNIVTSIYRTYSYSEAQQSLKALYTITNGNAEEITIKEVILSVRYTHTSSGSSSACVIDRTVLDTPVTIPAGGVGQVEYTITFNLPTATTQTN